MKQELVEWEKEEQERRDKELAIQQGQQIVSLGDAAREKSTPERVSLVYLVNYTNFGIVNLSFSGMKGKWGLLVVL